MPEAPTLSVERVHEVGEALRRQIGERIVGLDDVVEQVLISVFTRQHVLLEGVPGLAKTLLLSTVAQLLDLSFSRIQFTPDLMPSDVTGSEYLVQDAVTGQREFRFAKGPIFANVVLADEINRAPPKTQAALMEAMEEGQVTSLGVSRRIDTPFFVLATQNPIEQEGTYALPAAQLDRFLFKVHLGYPTWDQEERIARMTTRLDDRPLEPVTSKDELMALQRTVLDAPVDVAVVRYAVELAQATRPTAETAPDLIREYVQWGAGPRAAQSMIFAARARALLRGRATADHEDVAAVAPAVLRHRLITSYAADADGVTTEDVTRLLLRTIDRPGLREAQRPAPWWVRWFRSLLEPATPRRRSA